MLNTYDYCLFLMLVSISHVTHIKHVVFHFVVHLFKDISCIPLLLTDLSCLLTATDTNDNARKDVPRPDSPRLSSSESTGPRNISSDISQSSIIETPLGVVRQSSSSNVEPARLHSGTSQELFRHGMSMHKLTSMPAINEDETSSEEEEEGDTQRKSAKKRRAKRPRPKGLSIKSNPQYISEEDETSDDILPPRPPSPKGIKRFIRGLFTCSKGHTYDRSKSLLKGENV